MAPGDADFSIRWAGIKARFTRAWLAEGGDEQIPKPGRARKGGRGVWQERFWEHQIRDLSDLNRHLDYIHWNQAARIRMSSHRSTGGWKKEAIDRIGNAVARVKE